LTGQSPGAARDAAETLLRSEIKSAARELLTFRWDDLLQVFGPDRPVLSRIHTFARDLSEMGELHELPRAVLEDLGTGLRELYTCVQTVATTRSGVQVADGRASLEDDLIQRLDAAHATCYRAIASWLALRFVAEKDVRETQYLANEHVARLNNLANEHLGRINTAVTEIEALKRTAEGAASATLSIAADVGIARHAAHFDEEARRHGRNAKWWLATMATVGVAAVISMVLLGRHASEEARAATAMTPYLIQLGVSKLAVLSLFYYVTVWASRNYRTHLHNQTVNRHRHNALRTFDAFLAAAHDRSTKDAVLVQVTQSIFAPQATGHIAPEADGAGPASLIEGIISKRGG
jgi:hypothetical protein